MANRHFRAGVVAVVERSDGAVLAFERADAPGCWQLPQGGMEVGEDPIDTVWRELREETGLTVAEVTMVGEHPAWVAYEWPREVSAGRKGIGQVQRWFRFTIDDDATEPRPDGQEFTAWRWVGRDWLVEHVIAFRRPAYRSVLGAGRT